LAVLALGAVSLVLSGCGVTSAGSSDGPRTDREEAEVAHAASLVDRYRAEATTFPEPGPPLDHAKVAALSGKTVLFVPIGAGAAPFIQQKAALEAALARVGIRLDLCDPKFVPTAAAMCMTGTQANAAAAVITSGVPFAVAPNAYRALATRRTPTLAANSGPGSPPNTGTLAYMPFVAAAEKQARLQADVAVAAAKGARTFLYVNGIDSPVLKDLAAATTAEMKARCAACQVIDAGFSTTNINQLPALVSSRFIRDPDIDTVLIQADSFVPGVLSGIQSAGVTAKVRGVGQSADLSVLEMIRRGQFISADVGVSNPYEGWLEADGILRLLTGSPVEREPFVPIRIFDTKNLAGADLTPSANIDTLFGSAAYQDAFLRAWGVR